MCNCKLCQPEPYSYSAVTNAAPDRTSASHPGWTVYTGAGFMWFPSYAEALRASDAVPGSRLVRGGRPTYPGT